MKYTKAQLEAMLKEADEVESTEAEEVAEEVVEEESVEEVADDSEAVEKMVKGTFQKVAKDLDSKVSVKLDKALGEMKSEIEAYLKEQKEAIETKSGAYADEVQAKTAKFNTYLKSFVGAIMSGDDAKAKEMSTDKTGTPFAGYVVDSELSAEIRHLVTQYGVARREFFSTALSKNAYEANALATDVTVAWVSEAGAIASTQVVLNQEELKLKKLGAIVSLTRELIEDQEVDLFNFIATRVAEGFAKAEDTAFFAGEGVGDTANGEYTGLLYNTDIQDVTFADVDTITAEEIYSMIDTLPQGAHAGAKFYMNRTILSKIRLIKDGDGRYIYNNPLNESGSAVLAGYPVVLVEAMPKESEMENGDPFILFGDLKKTAILGYRNGIVADRFNAGVIRNVAGNADINLITTDREAIRWISRVGYITILPSACVRGIATSS